MPGETGGNEAVGDTDDKAGMRRHVRRGGMPGKASIRRRRRQNLLDTLPLSFGARRPLLPPKEAAASVGQTETTGNNDPLPSTTDSTLDNCMEGAYTTISTGERIALEINGQGLIQSELIVV